MKQITLNSKYDGLPLSAAVFTPEQPPKAVVCCSHGMAEHKERYFDFLQFLCDHGYACIIHDHRGHGASVRSSADLGYFYTDDTAAIVEDLLQMLQYGRDTFPGIPVYLFSHSMGTLVARCLLRKYDTQVDKVVLCGPPTRNAAVGAGLALAGLAAAFGGSRKPNAFLNALCFNAFNKGYTKPFSWLSVNEENVDAYINDPLCGYTFTTNGFLNLLKLQRDAYVEKGWECRNTGLPLLLIAGENDPCIISKENFRDLSAFLCKVGYPEPQAKLYEGKRHEILNENHREETYLDVLNFFENA